MMNLEASLRLYRQTLEHAPIASVDHDQIEQTDRCLDFLARDEKCFERSNPHGHFTGSGLVIDPFENKTLLVHHVKYNEWVMPGGHCDGIVDPFFTAWEEMFQETGLKDIRPMSPWVIKDVDIQMVSPYKDVPAHLHYDIRYWFRASSKVPFVVSDESNAIAWVKPSELKSYSAFPPLVRLVEGYFGAGSTGA